MEIHRLPLIIQHLPEKYHLIRPKRHLDPEITVSIMKLEKFLYLGKLRLAEELVVAHQ